MFILNMSQIVATVGRGLCMKKRLGDEGHNFSLENAIANAQGFPQRDLKT